MTFRTMLEWRRRELVSFFRTLYGTKYWCGPAAYATNVPRCLFERLGRHRINPMLSPRKINHDFLTPNDVFRAEEAALLLGFAPQLPHTAFFLPVPKRIAPGSFPPVLERWADWKARNKPRSAAIPFPPTASESDSCSNVNVNEAKIAVLPPTSPSAIPASVGQTVEQAPSATLAPSQQTVDPQPTEWFYEI